MAACTSLQHIFEKPLPEDPSVFESLSWSPIKSMNLIDNVSLNEIFGNIDFKENHHGESDTPPSSSSLYPTSPPSSVSSSSSSSSFTSSKSSNNHHLGGIERLIGDDNEKNKNPFSQICYYPKKQCRHKDSFSSMSSEGLGFESSDEVEEYTNDNISLDWRHRREEKQGANVIQEPSEYMYCDHKRSRMNKRVFPPPISCIGGNGKPFVNFKSYRENGRFILKEVRIPQQEFLRASRENGRLKLELVSSDDDFFEEDDDEEEIDDDESFDLKDIKEVVEDIKEEDPINEKEFHETNVDGEEQDQINNNNEEKYR